MKLALNGLNAILNAVVKYKVKRFILTATYESLYSKNNAYKLNFDEPFLANPTNQSPYPYQISKLQVELNLMQFWVNLSIDKRFESVVILPGHILGPSLTGRDHYSNNLIKEMLSG